MSADLIWLARAEKHLESIFEYISVDSPGAAAAYVETIVEACAQLRTFPSSGRRYNDRFRVLVVRNHLVFYRNDDGGKRVIIAAIIDGRRDVAAVLAGD